MIRFLAWLVVSLLTYGVLCFLLTLIYAVTRLKLIHKMMWFLYQYWINQLVKHAKRHIPGIETHLKLDEVKGPYLIIANHYSWLDVLIIYTVLTSVAPGFVFVMKRSLIKMPMIGIICWGLGHPMMRKSRKRIGRKLANHIALEVAAKEARQHEYGIMIFPEGTRYNIHSYRKSHYQNLMNPKYSGLSILHEAMQPVTVIDITLAYEKHSHTIKDFLFKRVGGVKVYAEQFNLGSLEIESWLQDRWQKKDQLLTQIQYQHLITG